MAEMKVHGGDFGTKVNSICVVSDTIQLHNTNNLLSMKDSTSFHLSKVESIERLHSDTSTNYVKALGFATVGGLSAVYSVLQRALC